jgi:hypothetical protein
MIGKSIASPNSCPHANRRILGVWKACYHDAVLSGNGQVLVIGSSVVQNDNYDDAYNMIITTYKWNATIDGDWDLMENKGGSSPQATTWQKNALPYQMMALCLQCVLILVSRCTPGMWISLVGFHEMLSLILTIYQQL